MSENKEDVIQSEKTNFMKDKIKKRLAKTKDILSGVWFVMAFQFFIVLFFSVPGGGGLPENIGFTTFFILIFNRQSINFLLLILFLIPLIVISFKKAIKASGLCWILSIAFWIILSIGRYVPESLVFFEGHWSDVMPPGDTRIHRWVGWLSLDRNTNILLNVYFVIPFFSAFVLISKFVSWIKNNREEKKKREEEEWKIYKERIKDMKKIQRK